MVVEEACVFDGDDGVEEVGTDVGFTEGFAPLAVGCDEGAEGLTGGVAEEGGVGRVSDAVGGIGTPGDGGVEGDEGGDAEEAEAASRGALCECRRRERRDGRGASFTGGDLDEGAALDGLDFERSTGVPEAVDRGVVHGFDAGGRQDEETGDDGAGGVEVAGDAAGGRLP